jgi:tRNA-dihydrouridine synthase
VQQRYIGASNWEFLTEVRQNFSNQTILGSGDLYTAQDCVRMIQTTGVDGVTAARGSIGNPWIFSQARALLSGLPLPPPPGIHEQREVLQTHFELAEKVHSESRAARQLRKFGMRYADWHPQAEHVRAAFINSRNVSMWNLVLATWYATDGPGRYPISPGLPKPPTVKSAADAQTSGKIRRIQNSVDSI